MSDTEHPLDKLKAAVQEFVNSQVEDPVLVDVAVVVWEEVGFDGEGNTQRRIRYAVPTDSFSMSGTLGLLEASREYVRRDILGTRCCDDDD